MRMEDHNVALTAQTAVNATLRAFASLAQGSKGVQQQPSACADTWLQISVKMATTDKVLLRESCSAKADVAGKTTAKTLKDRMGKAVLPFWC